MGNQVTIKLDSRLFYGLIAIVAVVGIFAIGWWLGKQLAGPGVEQTAQTQGAQPAVAQQGTQFSANPSQQQVSQASKPASLAGGRHPVSVDEVPVGEAEPRLWIEELSAENNFTYDLGQVPADQPTEKDFTITNVGTAELVISDASASCGCTAAVVDKSNVGPGEYPLIRVSYDPRVNKEQGRFVQKQVRIRSNDPQAPLVEFSITADVAAQ